MNAVNINPFDLILNELSVIRTEIRGLKPQQVPDAFPDSLTAVQALGYLKHIGLPMKLGQFYKLTANGTLPCQKLGKRLVLSKKELDQWIESQKHRKEAPKDKAAKLLADSANRRLEKADR